MFWQKNRATPEASNLTPTNAPVSDTLIVVCEKCGKKLAKSPDENPARELQQKLKETIRAEDGKGKMRAVTTSCLDICPDGAIAVGILSMAGFPEFFTATGSPEDAAQMILEKAKAKKS